MELIKITEKEGKKLVSARELYDNIGLNKSQFSRWAKKNITNSPFAIENDDWAPFDIMSTPNDYQDFALTTDFAKRLAMMARTEQGEKIRLYFIECEKQAKQPRELSRSDLARMIIESESERERVALQLNMANETIKEQAPKVQYVEKVLSSVATFHATSIGADFGMSAVALNRKLKEMGVQHKIDGHWVLNARYKAHGYEDYRTVPYLNSKDEQCTAKEMVWTEKGRLFIHELFAMKKVG